MHIESTDGQVELMDIVSVVSEYLHLNKKTSRTVDFDRQAGNITFQQQKSPNLTQHVLDIQNVRNRMVKNCVEFLPSYQNIFQSIT